MLTHNQTIHAITHIVPTLQKDDHGKLFWVGMPVDGPTQTGPAFIAAWEVPGAAQPTDEQINAAWAQCSSTYVDPASAPPTVATKRTALLALYDLKGITKEQISAAIASIEDDSQRYRAQVDWEDASEVHRADATVRAIAAMLSLSEQDLDALFLKTRDYSA